MMKCDAVRANVNFSSQSVILTRLDPVTGGRTGDHVRVLQFKTRETHQDK